ncbi:MAG: GNAT family N-acetyltransferase [Miltoncostaeaceae bacterium]
MEEIHGHRVVLRPATEDDREALMAVRATPEVRLWWPGDPETELDEALADPDTHGFVVVDEGGRTVGFIQWYEEDDPDYRHAGIDIYLSPEIHGRGLGTDAVRTLARHLIEAEGHHRLIIDPAAQNEAAIACYRKVGFRDVGTMRRYERGADGTWHDSLLMDLLADELT